MIPALAALIVVLAPQIRQNTGTTVHLAVDGVNCGYIRSADGGDLRADAVAEPAGPDRIARKHVGAVRYTPIVLEVGASVGKPVFDWMNDLLAGRSPKKTLVLTTVTFAGQTVSALKAANCVLTRIEIPTLESLRKEPGFFTLTVAPEKTETVAPGAVPPLPGAQPHAKLWTLSNYKVTVPGLDASKVVKIDAITISAKSPADPVEVSNLGITLAESTSAGWRAWLDDFVGKGNNADDQEKPASIEILGGDVTTVLLTIRLKNVGILTLATAPPIKEIAFDIVRAELYCERMEISVPLGAVAPVGGIEATLAPADQGAADPADFPRPAGMVRKTYVVQKARSGASESAVYSTRMTVKELDAEYAKLTKDAGWEQLQRTDAGGAVVVSWRKATRVAQVALAPSKDGVDVTVAITEKR